MSLVKVQNKGQVTIPTRLRTRAGIAEGDLVEAKFSRGKIILTPKTVLDRSTFPAADGDYTPAQRMVVDARLAGARKGPYFGPFETAEEMIASMKGQLKKRAAIKKIKRAR
jgi:AbrB family looped-hinge helix DNA binding protein